MIPVNSVHEFWSLCGQRILSYLFVGGLLVGGEDPFYPDPPPEYIICSYNLSFIMSESCKIA